MTVDGISSVNSLPEQQPTPPAQTGMQGMDQDAFLQLLLAQLQNQDPLKPMEDKDFIAQLAQFNSLNQLTEMNTNIEALTTAQTLTQGAALIGKTISGLSTGFEPITGTVSGLQITGGAVMLDVNGMQVPLDTVRSVEETG